MEQKSDEAVASKDITEKLMGLSEEDLFAMLGLEVLVRVDSGIQRKDYSKSEPSFYQDKVKAEKLVGEPISDGQWGEILYMNERVTAANELLRKGEASYERLDPKNFDKNYTPDPRLLQLYAKLVSAQTSA